MLRGAKQGSRYLLISISHPLRSTGKNTATTVSTVDLLLDPRIHLGYIGIYILSKGKETKRIANIAL